MSSLMSVSTNDPLHHLGKTMNRRHASAAVVLGTATVFLATACGPSDFSSSAPANDTKASATADPAATSSPASSSGNQARSASSLAPSTAVPAAPADRGKAASPVRTQALPDGSKAMIYKLGDEHYLARVVHGGQVFVTLETNRHDAGIDANDMFIVLTLDGQVHSWMGGGHQGPGTFKLPGGWTAKVTKIGDLRYRAQILGNQGEVYATVETNQHDIGFAANGGAIVLSNGGVISAHE
jgi:hypothetical protein